MKKHIILILFAVFLIQIGLSMGETITFPTGLTINDILRNGVDMTNPLIVVSSSGNDAGAAYEEINTILRNNNASRWFGSGACGSQWIAYNFSAVQINGTIISRNSLASQEFPNNISIYYANGDSGYIKVTPTEYYNGWGGLWTNPLSTLNTTGSINWTLPFANVTATSLKINIHSCGWNYYGFLRAWISNATGLSIADTTSPAISSVWNGSINQTSVRINFTTNENTNASVFLGTTRGIWILNLTNTTLSTEHSLYTNSLTDSTTYYYNVSACDAAGNCNMTGTFNFTTQAYVLYTINFSSVYYPANDTQTSESSVLFNLSLNYSSGPTFCYLNINGSINETKQLNISSGNVYYCYQEFANETSTCGGVSGGSYTFSGSWNPSPNANNTIDGDWTTYGSYLSQIGYLDIIYKKPLLSTEESLWRVGFLDAAGLPTSLNYSIPSACWNFNSTHILLRVTSKSTNPKAVFSCYDSSTSLINISPFSVNGYANWIIEEAMWWEINNLTLVNTTNVELNFLKTFNDGRYIWNITCNNSLTTTATENRILTIDSGVPSITFNNDNGFTASNYSTENVFDNNFTLSFLFSDTYDLYGYIVNVTKDGVIIYNTSNTSLAGTTYNFTKTLNTTDWTDGTYNVYLLVADGHTALTIPDYTIARDTSKLTFTTPEKNTILIESADISSVDAEKKGDRYSFDFDFVKKTTEDRIFYISSDKKIDYRQKSKYKAHFVVWNPETRSGNWIDFEGLKADYFVEKISDYKYKIIFFEMEPKVKFNSIGGLNTYSATYSFYKGLVSYNQPAAFEKEPSTYTLNLTKDSTISNISAVIIWNGTHYPATKTMTSTYAYFSVDIQMPSTRANTNISFYWNVSITQADTSDYIFYTDNKTTYIYTYSVTDCTSPFNTSSLEFLLYWENNLSRFINGSDMEVLVNYWSYDKQYSFNFTYNATGRDNLTLCIYPTNKTIFADLYLKYVDTYTNRYFLVNHTINGTLQSFNIYSLNTSTDVSLLRITLRNQNNYNYFQNVVAKLQRFYVGENVWRTIQMDKSGEFGLVTFQIYEKTTDYRLIFVNEAGTILKTTDSMKFSCTSSVCEFTQILNPDTLVTSTAIQGSISYSNDTKILTAYFTNPSGESTFVNLTIRKETANAITYLCSQSTTAAAGYLYCNLTGYDGEVFVQFKTDSKNLVSQYIDLGKTKLFTFIGDKEGGMWAVFIIIVAAMFGLFSPVAALISVTFSLIAIYFLGLFSPLTITFLIVAVAMALLVGLKVRT